jgi:hypothetical protein
VRQRIRGKQKEFPLIDILIVIAIILITSMVFLSVFARAKEKLLRSTGQSSPQYRGAVQVPHRQDNESTASCGTCQPRSASVDHKRGGQISPDASRILACGYPSDAKPDGTGVPAETRYDLHPYVAAAIPPENAGNQPPVLNQMPRIMLWYEGRTHLLRVKRSTLASPAGSGTTSQSRATATAEVTALSVAGRIPAHDGKADERQSGGARFQRADGYVKWLHPRRVLYSYDPFINSTGAFFYRGSGSQIVQRTDHRGTGQKLLPFRYR